MILFYSLVSFLLLIAQIVHSLGRIDQLHLATIIKEKLVPSFEMICKIACYASLPNVKPFGLVVEEILT